MVTVQEKAPVLRDFPLTFPETQGGDKVLEGKGCQLHSQLWQMTLNVWTFNCVAFLISKHDVLHGATGKGRASAGLRVPRRHDWGGQDSRMLDLGMAKSEGWLLDVVGGSLGT